MIGKFILYDGFFKAMTAYFVQELDMGKASFFEGLAVLEGNGKLIVVISLLKALEYNQVSQDSFTQFLTYSFHNYRQTKLWKKASK